MTPKEKIQKDLNEALKAKEELRTSVLRLLSAVILNKEKEKRYKLKKEEDAPLSDEEILELISSEVKKRKEASELYERGARLELAEKERNEIEILQNYLPEPLSEEELKALIKEAIKKVGANNPKDMGKIMGVLMPQVRGRADGNLVSKFIKEMFKVPL